MAQENPTKSGKKNAVWLFGIPLLILVVLFFSKYASLKSGFKFTASQSAQFAPEELDNLVSIFNSNNVAGKCASKYFYEFDDEKWNYDSLNRHI